MNKSEFSGLLGSGEATWLDWKGDFSAGLLGGKQHVDWEKSRGALLKDLISIANGSDGLDRGYLVFGVRDDGMTRTITGISKSFDDSIFQVWAENTFEPPPTFTYTQLKVDSGELVGIFTIRRTGHFPHVAVENVGGIVCEGQVWFRRGTKNTVAHADELGKMFIGDKPMTFGTTQDPAFSKFVESLYDGEWEPVLPYASEKEARIATGYEVVRWPGTRTEVWVGPKGQELIVMRRRKKKA